LAKAKTRTLLIDGDIWGYKAAVACEYATKWDEDLWTLHASEKEAKFNLRQAVNRLQEQMEADRVIFALSHPEEPNFRYDVLPSYKSNRAEQRKPIVLAPLKAYMRETWDCYQRPKLEGDDVLGVLATSKRIIPGEKIVVSVDKDLATIPGKLLNLQKADALIEDEDSPVENRLEAVRQITRQEADYNHMIQTLSGDATDGYKGCPKVGEKTAHKVLEGLEPKDWWPAVVQQYVKQNLGEEAALQQARVARICRREDYDFKNNQPIYWTPDKLTG
jgi:DNA polymerase-1